MYILGINAYHADSSACIIKDQNLKSHFGYEQYWLDIKLQPKEMGRVEAILE